MDYQRILKALADRIRRGQGPLTCQEMAADFGMDVVPARVEALRSKAKRLVARGWLAESAPGRFTLAAVGAGDRAEAKAEVRLRRIGESSCGCFQNSTLPLRRDLAQRGGARAWTTGPGLPPAGRTAIGPRMTTTTTLNDADFNAPIQERYFED